MLHIAVCDPQKSDAAALGAIVRKVLELRSEEFDLQLFSAREEMQQQMYNCRTVFDMAFLCTDCTSHDMKAAAEEVRKYNRHCTLVFAGGQDILGVDALIASGFLKKPFVPDSVAQVVMRALDGIDPTRCRHYTVRTARKDYDLFYDNLLYVESNRRIITIHTRQGFTFSCYQKLSELEEALGDRRFLRCHQSFLANMDHIINIIGHSFIMEGGDPVKIRQSGISKIKEAYFAWALGRTTTAV